MKGRPRNVGGRRRMTTFTSTDAKLRRLLYWYHQHSDKISPLIASVSAHNIALLKYSEKQEMIKVLTAAQMKWTVKQRVQRHKKQQQPITKFFKVKPKAKASTTT